ncbi:MAG: ABC transporter permease [Nitrospirota bacterium]|nr:ABC transporter permease [Nitrospirota bacterium]
MSHSINSGQVSRVACEDTVVHLCPSRGWVPIQLRELWDYRELISLLVWRDLKAAHAQTVLGVAWVFVKPAVLMTIFTIVFGLLAKIPSDGIPYPLFMFSALLPWQYFARALSGASTSLVANQHLITKVYFPRLVIPLSAMVGPLFEFGISTLLLLLMMGFYEVVPTRGMWLLPMFLLMGMCTAFGAGIWLSALSVRFRDVAHAHPFMTQIWFFATPVLYPSSLVPESWRWLYWMNPMAGVIEGFRWALLGTGRLSVSMVVSSLVVMLVMLVPGLYVFRRMERTFADRV